MKGMTELMRGSGGVICRLDEEALASERLAVLGFLPGREVRLLRAAPLGDPAMYEVGGRLVSLRRAEAACVWLSDDEDMGVAS